MIDFQHCHTIYPYPKMQVNAKYCGKTALHCAAAAGKVSVMKMLFNFQADIEMEVKAVCNTSLIPVYRRTGFNCIV